MRKGFKLSEIGLIPEDWEVFNLKEISNIKSGKTHEQFISDFGEFICVNSKFISSEGNIKKFSSINRSKAKIGDILMVMSDLPNGKALAKAIHIDKDNIFAINQRICAVSPHKNFSSRYLFYVLNRNEYFLKFDDGVNQTNLKNKIFEDCPIATPPTKEEQKLIAEALGDTDLLIKQINKIIIKKSLIKKGTMKILLNGEKRLSGFYKDWKVKKFGEIFNFLKTATNSRDDLSTNNEAFYIHYGDIHTKYNSILDFSQKNPPMIDLKKCKNASLLRNGDWILADASENFEGIGKAIEVVGLREGQKAVAGLHTFLLREKSEMFAPGFKGHLGGLQSLNENYLRVATGMKVYGLSKTALKDLELPIPDYDEQIAITTILNDMDNEISYYKNKLLSIINIKKGMLRKLVSGKLRLLEL